MAGLNSFRRVGSGGPLGSRWYFCGQTAIGYNNHGFTPKATSSSLLYATELLGGRGVTIAEVGTWVSALGSAANMRLGIYNVTPNSAGLLYPTTRLVDFGTKPISTGWQTITGLSQVLAAGKFYQAAMLFDGTGVGPTVSGLNAREGPAWLGGDVSLNSGGFITVVQSFGVLPDPFPAGAIVLASATGPTFGCRFSA